MPEDTKDGSQLDNASDSGTAVLEQPGDGSAQTGGEDAAEQAVDGGQGDSAAGEAAGAGAKNEDPDADIKAMLREGRETKPVVEAKGGKEVDPKAGADAKDAKDGKPAGDKKPGDAAQGDQSPFAQRIEQLGNEFKAEFDDETSTAFGKVLAIVKDMEAAHAKQIADLTAASKGFTEYQQSAGTQKFHGVLDGLAADDTFGKLLGNSAEEDLSKEQMELRAQIWEDAGMVFDLAKSKGKPISERRAVLFAARQALNGGKSDETVEQQRAAQKRQSMRSVAPKSGGGGIVKDPSSNSKDPDAAAHEAVEATLRSFGKRR